MKAYLWEAKGHRCLWRMSAYWTLKWNATASVRQTKKQSSKRRNGNKQEETEIKKKPNYNTHIGRRTCELVIRHYAVIRMDALCVSKRPNKDWDARGVVRLAGRLQKGAEERSNDGVFESLGN